MSISPFPVSDSLPPLLSLSLFLQPPLPQSATSCLFNTTRPPAEPVHSSRQRALARENCPVPLSCQYPGCLVRQHAIIFPEISLHKSQVTRIGHLQSRQDRQLLPVVQPNSLFRQRRPSTAFRQWTILYLDPNRSDTAGSGREGLRRVTASHATCVPNVKTPRRSPSFSVRVAELSADGFENEYFSVQIPWQLLVPQHIISDSA